MRMNKKGIIAIVLCVAVFFMAVGYSILSTELKISGGANITSTWDIRITDISGTNNNTSAYNLVDPSYTANTAKFKVVLVNPGDSMTYKVTIQNKGTLTAILNGMTITDSGTSSIIYEVTGLKDGDTIAADETKILTINVKYNSNAIADPDQRIKTLNVGLDWVQYTNQVVGSKIYTIKYHPNGGTGTMDNTICTVGSSCTISTNSFNRNGGIFKGWSTTPTGPHMYSNGQVVTNLTSANKMVTLYAIWDNTLVTNILSNSNVQSGDGIDFASSPRDANGLYSVSTGTENNKTTYFYRGYVSNNYVQFGSETSNTGTCTYNGNPVYEAGGDYGWTVGDLVTDQETCNSTNVCYINNGALNDKYVVGLDESMCTDDIAMGTFMGAASWEVESKDLYWRIVRINEDGSIRLITVDSIGTTNYGAYGDNADIGYMYGSTGQNNYTDTHENINDSAVKSFIDDWYEAHLKENYGSYLADAGFCNDRSIASTANTWASDDTALGYGDISTNYTYYGSYNRLNNTRQVQFACPRTEDLFTLKTGSKGNKALENPVGLITADEIVYAVVADDMASAILDYNTTTLTMSPARSGFVYMANNWPSVNETERAADVRPVINLRSDVTVELTGTGDPGTITNPYIIKTN